MSHPRLSRIGRQMIVHRILRDNQSKLQLFGAETTWSGLSRQMAQTITELHQYAKTPDDVEKLLSKIQKKNQLVGSTYRVNDRIIFVGEKSVRQELVAVVLGLFRNGKEAESMLLGLSNRMRTYDRTIVLLPFFDRTPQSALSRLESQKTIVARFEEAFPVGGGSGTGDA